MQVITCMSRFQKKAGGADAEMAPIGAQLVTAADALSAGNSNNLQ